MSRNRYVDSPDVMVLNGDQPAGLAFTNEGRRIGLAVSIASPEGIPPKFVLCETDVRVLRDFLDDWLRIEVIC